MGTTSTRNARYGNAMTGMLHLDDGSTLVRDWSFVPSRAPLRIRLLRARNRLLHRVSAPASEILKLGVTAQLWSAYFIFTTDGTLQAAHRFTLDRLAAMDRRLLVICAAPTAADVPGELRERADMLVWKALPGFDFSAYALALRSLAEVSPGCDALILNDSVFGPLGDVEPMLAAAPWDLTGFTATANVENHIQSFAFHLRGITLDRLRALAPVLAPTYDSFWDVVLNQETRFARIADHSLTVGSALYADSVDTPDPLLQRALPLVRAGFPFLKRSLLGKLAHLHPRGDILAALEAAGHPLP